MPFWNGETLAKRLPGLIEPYDEAAIDCAAYTLHIGHEIYISPDGTIKSPNRHTKQVLGEREGFAIPPGQFAFLLTMETVTVPDNALAFISIKGRVKFKGLINISGFHADPGYKGQLLFSVLNAGPKPLHLQQGQALFLIWYADLDGATQRTRNIQGFDHIEPELVNGISGEILSLQSLSDKQHSLESQLKLQRAVMAVFMGPILLALIVEVTTGLISKLLKLVGGG